MLLYNHFVCITLISVDQLIKYIFSNHISHSIIKCLKIPMLLRVSPTPNEGAAFGIFADSMYMNKIMIVISSIIISYIYQFEIKNPVSKRSNTLPVFVILAGAISNCIDRVINDYVFDFIELCPAGKTLFIFNIADAMITIGAIWVFINIIRGKK